MTGAFGWSIVDNYECKFSLLRPSRPFALAQLTSGFLGFAGSSVKFGLQYLNYETLERVPKASAFQFVDWFKKYGGAKLSDKA